MAFEMSFTDEFGEVYPSSYWKVVQCNLDRIQQAGIVIFNGYASSATLGKRIIATKTYRVDPDLYQTFFETAVLNPLDKNPYRSAYLMALAIKDVPAAVESDPSVSFFEDAQQV